MAAGAAEQRRRRIASAVAQEGHCAERHRVSSLQAGVDRRRAAGVSVPLGVNIWPNPFHEFDARWSPVPTLRCDAVFGTGRNQTSRDRGALMAFNAAALLTYVY